MKKRHYIILICRKDVLGEKGGRRKKSSSKVPGTMSDGDDASGGKPEKKSNMASNLFQACNPD